MRWKQIEERLSVLIMRLAIFLILAAFASVLWTVIRRGVPALNLQMLIKVPSGGFYLGKDGGILNAIAGSLMLACFATAIVLALSLPVVFYANVYSRSGSRLARMVRLALELLWGVPSIIYGAFGFYLMIIAGLRASLLAGVITLAFLSFPIMARAMDEIMRAVPVELMESSYSVGATRLETALKVVLRQTLPGLIGASILSFGRAIGDAASVLFTAGFSDRIPVSLADPAASLPLAVFFQLGSPLPVVRERAYAAALVLTLIVLASGTVARILAARYRKHVVRQG